MQQYQNDIPSEEASALRSDSSSEQAGTAIPSWPGALVNLGEELFSLSCKDPERRITLAVCLPRVDYAGLFIGLGILTGRTKATQTSDFEKKMAALRGKYVIFQPLTGRNKAGILNFSESTGNYSVRHFNKKTPNFEDLPLEKRLRYRPPAVASSSTILHRADWEHVHPAGKSFNPTRRVSRTEVERICTQLSKLSKLASLFSSSILLNGPDGGKSVFTLVGNRTRLLSEMSADLLPANEACLEGVLRPQGNPNYAESFNCKIDTCRSFLLGGAEGVLVFEATRHLGDHLVASRNHCRVILLARNSADYEDCAGQIIEQRTLVNRENPAVQTELPLSIRYLAFFHA